MNDNKDFLDFKNSASKDSPPKEWSDNILKAVHDDLNPQQSLVFSKLVGLQAFVGALTLLFCPQFNYSLTNSYELFHFFHRTFGHYVCMSICGSLFIGSGALLASFLLSKEEVRVIKQHRFLYYFSLSGLSILIFLFLGANVYLEISLFWFIGAFLGGISMISTNSLLSLVVEKVRS